MESSDTAAAAVGAGTIKRRKRSAAERLRIVEETLVPGASVARVARAHGINANQVFAWCKLHLAGRLVCTSEVGETAKPAAAEMSMTLLPVSVRNASPFAEDAATAEAKQQPSSIDIQFAKAKVHVEGGADLQLLRAVLECLRG